MPFKPHDKLWNRSFLGLIVAQFQAAFSDQAIHASAMFYAIHTETMSEADAISLMPILFYAPWALFVTLAGYLADRYSKRSTLVFWKVVELAIMSVTIVGFYLGTVRELPIGPYLVLSAVFLMGTHSAFFVPAKYGVMPELFEPQLLSRGNGWLESLSFLAVILGTVFGGVLSYVFRGEEYWIGVILLGLSILGASVSFLIEDVPPANPQRRFPKNLFRPLYDNLALLLRSRALALAVLGIAFFTFMVAFMRAAMYMHGETRIPRWTELHTSIVVGVVALGVGLGSPLAGSLSGGKIELGLVPLGALGMIAALVVAAFSLHAEAALIVCLAAVGFFTGFYIVPLFTLLQHRAPKQSKGDVVASSNFINVIGAIAASVLFRGLVTLAGLLGVIQAVEPVEVARGELLALQRTNGHPVAITVQLPSGQPFEQQEHPVRAKKGPPVLLETRGRVQPASADAEGTTVLVTRYEMLHQEQRIRYYRVQPADEPVEAVFNKEPLTSYLFLGAAIMTLGILLLLCRQLPDLLARSLIWLRARGRYQVVERGMNHLPTLGPVLLATDCGNREEALQIIGLTDRCITFVLLENPQQADRKSWLRWLANQTDMVLLEPGRSSEKQWELALRRGRMALQRQNVLGVSVSDPTDAGELEAWLRAVREGMDACIVPAHCWRQPLSPAGKGRQQITVILGEPLPPSATLTDMRTALRMLAKSAAAGSQVHVTAVHGSRA